VLAMLPRSTSFGSPDMTLGVLVAADRPVRVSRNSINSIENGRFDPSLPLAFRIADAFGLSVEEVFDKRMRAALARSRQAGTSRSLLLTLSSS
jgi:DNA-binding XRE family transcriptional regulator